MAASLKAGLLWPIAIFEHQHSPNVKGQNRSSALLPFMAGGNLGEACFLLQRILKAKRNRDHAKAENLQKALLIPNFDDFNTRLRIFRDLLRCVQGIHASHHKHGDIKPENILFDKNGNVYLADYGCSSSLQKGISDVHVGTPEYMDIAGLTAAVKATEQQEYHLLDEALKQVDLYALAVTGCVLFGFLFNEMYPKHSPEGPSQGYITITRPDQSEEEILCGIDEGNPELAAYSNNWDKKGVTEEVLEALKTLLRKMVAPGKRPLAKEIANELARITAMHQSNPAPSNPDLSAQAAASTATLTAPRLG
jgi:serine/threonine protein kinase